MEHNDYIFFIIIALSVVVSVIKKARKQAADSGEDGGTGDVFRKLLEEMQRAAEPKKPATNPASRPASGSASGSVKNRAASVDTDRSVVVEQGYVVPENSHHQPMASPLLIAEEPEPVDPVLRSLNLQDGDELKKAVIYSEIFRTKF